MENGARMVDHVESGDLIDYFLCRLPSDREQEIEEHIAECGACAEAGRGLYALVFDVQRWNAKDYARALAEQAVARVLVTAAEKESNPSRKPLYERLLRDLGRVRAGLLNTIVRASDAEFLLNVPSPAAGWKIAPAYATRGTDPGTHRAERKVLLEAPGTNLHAAASVGLKGRTVVIEVADWPADGMPLAMLLNLQAGVPIPGQIEKPAENRYEISFQDVLPGPYVLLFTSMEKGPAKA